MASEKEGENVALLVQSFLFFIVCFSNIFFTKDLFKDTKKTKKTKKTFFSFFSYFEFFEFFLFFVFFEFFVFLVWSKKLLLCHVHIQ